MTILCPCGAKLKDGTDDLSYKAWVIPDQELHDAEMDIDRKAIAAVAAGTLPVEDVGMTWRVPFYARVRGMYQCPECGRIGISDAVLLEGGRLHWYRPETPDTSHEILRSRKVER